MVDPDLELVEQGLLALMAILPSAIFFLPKIGGKGPPGSATVLIWRVGKVLFVLMLLNKITGSAKAHWKKTG